MVRAWRERGVLAPLRVDLERTRAEPHEPGSLAPPTPAAPTISRRGLLALVGGASAGLLVVTAGQSAGGPLRRLALLAPRGEAVFDDGPNGFPVNKTAAAARITPAMTGAGWRLAIVGGASDASSAATSCWPCRSTSTSCRSPASRAGRRPSAGPACGCATSPRWQARRPAPSCAWSPCRRARRLRRATLGHAQHADERALLALRVNGADLSPDHGYPARMIVPALPGVHCTKWVASLTCVVIARARSATAPRRWHLARPRRSPSRSMVYALSRVLDPRVSRGLDVLVWLVGGAMLHDLVLLPLYSPLDGVARRVTRRVPARGAGDQPPARPGGDLGRAAARLLPADPLEGRRQLRAHDRAPVTGFAGRWLTITAGLFLASGLVYLVRVRASRARAPRPPAGDEDAPVPSSTVTASGWRTVGQRPRREAGRERRSCDQLVAAGQRDVEPPAGPVEREAVRAARQVVAAHRLDAGADREDEQRVAPRVGHVARPAIEAGDVGRAEARRRAPDPPPGAGVVEVEPALARGDDGDTSPAVEHGCPPPLPPPPPPTPTPPPRGRVAHDTFRSVADRGHRAGRDACPGAGERGASAAGGSSCTVCEPQPASAPSATASERLRRRRMAAASHARAPAFRGANVVPRIVIFAAAATVVAGTLIRHIHGGLGTATPPFVMVWGPRLHPLAVASVAVAAIAIVVAPRLVVAADRPASFAARVLALALVLGLALNVARAGTRGWDAIFDLRPGGSFEASNEYLPGLPALSYGTHFYLDRFAELVPSLPVNVAGHPPAPLLVLHGLGLTTAAGAAALCIGVAALSAPLTYALGRAVGSERDARLAAVLFACSPARCSSA